MESVHRLRAHGWFVGDDVVLPSTTIDHLAVGPAGILAVQVMWSNRPAPEVRAPIRARIAARQFQNELAAREVRVDVVPAVLACGPGQPEVEGGVKVVDGVAFLFDDAADEWLSHLTSRSLLRAETVDSVRDIVADLLEFASV